jgi:ABC-2 type transport system ATP-binding protein
MSVITIEGLTKRFGDVLAVDNLSFEVDQGTVVGFLGPNGAGKTTTLRTLLGGFSLGMRQRLGLATALLGNPKVLVLDEPANGLDPEGVHWLRGLLRHLADQGHTVLVSSHVLAEVAQTVDQVVIIARGRLVTQATLADLTERTRGTVRVRSADTRALRDLLTAQGATAALEGTDELVASGITGEQVGRAAATAGIAIYGMTAEQANLEEVFLQLTAPQGEMS